MKFLACGLRYVLVDCRDLSHSAQTFNSGTFLTSGPSGASGIFPGLWGGAVKETFSKAHDLWIKKPAIEMSLLLPGLAPWNGDMTPFADEGFINDFCGMNFTGSASDERGGGGLYWHRGILSKTSLNGECTNAYNTNVNKMLTIEAIDCFLGGLVVAGAPPQMLASYGTPAEIKLLTPRVKHWLDLSKKIGHNTESSVAWARMGSCVGRCVDQGTDSVFAIGYANGTASTPHVGIYATSTGWGNVTLSTAPTSGTTFVVFNGNRTASGSNLGPVRLEFGAQAWTEASFRGGSATQIELGGAFMHLNAQQVSLTITSANGSSAAPIELFPSAASGQQFVNLTLTVDGLACLRKH